jgi:hypothetical protein
MTCRIYCEHGALTSELRELQRLGRIELVHFRYDPDSASGKIAPTATPSAAQWRDLNVSWGELKDMGTTWADFTGSQHLNKILEILGASNRRDALHVDSAFKDGCLAFVTGDKGILKHRECLEELLGLRFFDPISEVAALREFIDARCGAA